jgi:membrane-associated phospholipid phosphatase
VLDSPSEVKVPPPPRPGSPAAARDERGLRAAVRGRAARDEARLRARSRESAVDPWLPFAMQFVSERVKNPPVSSRAYGYVSVAMHDAAVASAYWKYRYRRKRPAGDPLISAPDEPSYPSSYAAIAGAGSRVLAYLFPEAPRVRLEAQAEDVADLRVAAGVNHPSDARAGLALGRGVAERVIAHAKRDGSTRKWDGKRPRGRGYWDPPPGSLARPVEPLAGTWGTWVMKDGSQFRAPPPPKFGSPKFLAEARELVRIRENLTPQQKRIATFWAGGQGTPLPAGVWDQVMLEYVRGKGLSVPEQTRVFALLNVAMADAGVASWDTKFTYWNPRPLNGVRDSGVDRDFKPFLDTPFFPAYVSGHSTYSGAAEEVLAHLFPEDADLFRTKAREAGISRLYGGIHWRSDNTHGLRMGRKVGRLVVRHAQRDGAER